MAIVVVTKRTSAALLEDVVRLEKRCVLRYAAVEVVV